MWVRMAFVVAAVIIGGFVTFVLAICVEQIIVKWRCR